MPLPLPDGSRVKKIYLDQLHDNYMLLLTENNKIYCAGVLSTLSQSGKKKPAPLEGPVLQFYHSRDADITDVATAQGRVYAMLADGKLLCMEPDGLGAEVQADGTRKNAAGRLARKDPYGKYYCGRQHSGCRVSFLW